MEKELDDATKYLNKLAALIAENTNNSAKADGIAEPFSGKFALDNFCIEVVDLPENNAYSLPKFGNIYFDIDMMKNANNDAQVAAILSHEMAHILMAHNSDHISPNLRPSDLGATKELETMRAQCGDLQHLRLDSEVFGRFADRNETTKEIDDRLFSFFLDRKERELVFSLMHECDFAIQRQEDIKTMIDLSKDKLAVASDDSKNTWNEDMANYYKSLKDENAMKVLEDYKKIKNRIFSEFKEPDAIHNWKEQEADEVGLEILYRSNFNVKEAYRFWMFELQRNEGTVEECGQKMGSGEIIARGDKTHPDMCHRIKNLAYSELRKHAEHYRKNPSEVSTVFEGELEAIKAK